ncbi:MAG TPA: hypothetical protein VMG63_19450 [Terriglobia bacterium]|nr:hypothetical protein [Terriglobia bacterium]
MKTAPVARMAASPFSTNGRPFVWATRERGGPFSELRGDGICKPSVLKIGV